jgi:hypothetical protein
MTYFFRALIILTPYTPPATSRRESPPSIGVAGGGPCAKAGMVMRKRIKIEKVIFIFFIVDVFKER